MTSELINTAAALWSAELVHVVDEHERHAVFVAHRNRSSIFIKATADPDQAAQIENEVRANGFLCESLDATQFSVPRPLDEMPKREGAITAVAFEYVEATWFASKFPNMHLLRQVSDADIEDIVALMAALHRFNGPTTPRYFLDRASTGFTDDHYRARLQEYLMPVEAAGYVTRAQLEQLLAASCGESFDRKLVHHDIVPWNLGRDPEGRLVIVDAEFARWGMAYYDVAYFYLQTYIMLGDAELAKRALWHAGYVFDVFDRPTDHPFWKPMAYRLGANLNVALKYPDQMARALKLLPIVLARDLDALLAA
jgi:thiamine kinase-like enzyme